MWNERNYRERAIKLCWTCWLWAYLIPGLSAQPLPEMRGAWVPSVFNLCFPSRAGLSIVQQKTEIDQLVAMAQSLHINALFFQIRPESDALYDSTLEPWSRYLTGQQGVSPGLDPLAYLIHVAKPRGIAVHAWINPFRAAATATKPLAANHLANRFRSVAYPIDGALWMDPGSRAVQEEIVEVVQDVVKRYDIAGVHLDDYFYPYPTHPPQPVNFPDQSLYQSYLAGGGILSHSDWRRENVNRLIHRLSISIKTLKPGLLFGVSPFGIYRPGVPTGVHAELDQFEMLSADPVKWMREGWVDYLAPQLYWPEGSPQSFSALLAWWRNPAINPRGIPIYPGIALERLDPPFNWSPSEIVQQIELSRQIRSTNETGTGFILWQMSSLLRNTKGITSVLR